MLDFIRIACAVPQVQLADPVENARHICHYMEKADRQKADVLLFPEMALTGYTCADLFFQQTLLRHSLQGLSQVVEHSRRYSRMLIAVGLPLVISGQMYNCAAVICGGKLCGIVPKTYLPNYSEFYERRWFSSSEDLQQTQVYPWELGLEGEAPVPVGRDLLFCVGEGALIGVEICEDLWTPLSPSTLMCLGGAEIILNLSASNEVVGKRSQRRELVRHQSASCSCVYAYASSGCTESTQELVFSGHSLVASGGKLLAENEKLIDSDYLLVCDADLGALRAKRRFNKSVKDAVSLYGKVEPVRRVLCSRQPLRSDGSLYRIDPYPFVPADVQLCHQRCRDVFAIQTAGLAQRLRHLNAKAVVGVSGGLDSALALLVAVEAMAQLGRPASDVTAITMPCFGTTSASLSNALALMQALQVTCVQIPITRAVEQHFQDIGQDPETRDTTYENAQARERTQVLMDYAGRIGGIVIGTGDMSELALGWCTYNGDHMSMYGVNSSVPKTLMGPLLRYLGTQPRFSGCGQILERIVAAPITPELLPSVHSSCDQPTEQILGPYALHDFFLYHTVKYAIDPQKLYSFACRAFREQYDGEKIRHWLCVFYRRFFSQQFKRSSMPEGVKVGSVCLDPRGDWRMPSDASVRIWLEEAQKLSQNNNLSGEES